MHLRLFIYGLLIIATFLAFAVAAHRSRRRERTCGHRLLDGHKSRREPACVFLFLSFQGVSLEVHQLASPDLKADPDVILSQEQHLQAATIDQVQVEPQEPKTH